jgi:hypothetical protein
MLSRQPEASERLLTSFFDTGETDDSLFTYQPWEYDVGLGFPAIAKIVVGIIVFLIVVLIFLVRSFLKKQFERRYLTKITEN